MQVRALAEFLMAAFGVSIRRACRALRFNLSTYFYRQRRPGQAPLRMRLKVEGPPATQPNECRRMDFISDRLASGHSFRALTIVDNFTRECPAIEVDSSLTGTRVAAVLEPLKQTRGMPARLEVDNGPEFTSRALDAWAHLQRREAGVQSAG